MHRFLAIGYVITALTFAANVLVFRLSAMSLDGINRLLVGQAILIALLPAGVLLFLGARRSHGRLRKLLGYSISVFDLLGSASGCFAVLMILTGQAHLSAA